MTRRARGELGYSTTHTQPRG